MERVEEEEQAQGMSESLHDRVARVLEEHTLGLLGPFCGCGSDLDVRLRGGSRQAHAEHVADALIAAGLVTEPEWEYGVSDAGEAFRVSRCRGKEDALRELGFLPAYSYLVRRRPSTDWQEAPREAL